MPISHLTAFVVRNLGGFSASRSLTELQAGDNRGWASSGAYVGSELRPSLLTWLPVSKIQLLESCLSQALALRSC